jgi:hypothetical protein
MEYANSWPAAFGNLVPKQRKSAKVFILQSCEWCFNRTNSRYSCSFFSFIFLRQPQNGCPNNRRISRGDFLLIRVAIG